MNRQDEINKAAGQVLRDRMQENYFKIFAYYSDHKEEILSDLTQQISCMINQAKIQQETQGKQPIRYVAANFLLSSAITGSFDFKISLMDSLSFLDPIECCIYWSPKWIFAPAEDDKTNLWNQLRKEYVRLRPFELDTIWRIYIYAFYYSITGMFFAENLKTAAINGGLAQLDLIQETQFIFGGLMDRFAVIDTWERGA